VGETRSDVGQGRCALVTGANTGIGLACALLLAHRGFRVVATVRSQEKADVVHKAAAGTGVTLQTELLEVTDASGCAQVIDRWRPYALVNNAGINAVAAIEDTVDADLESILDINLVAPVRLTRLAVPHMRAQGGGRVVNVSSTEGRVVLPLLGCYQASKHGLEAVTATMRMELARDGIGVTSVQPGNVDTAIYDKRFWVEQSQGSRYDPGYRRLKKLMSMNARMQLAPDAVAEVVLKAILTRRPRPRYLVGLDAHALAGVHDLLPTVVRERLYRALFQL
jgi:NAD(P)-dependent dehydrogenase (short-subunit alcohol dehydrogenase family)